jgi:hypothetical protein
VYVKPNLVRVVTHNRKHNEDKGHISNRHFIINGEAHDKNFMYNDDEEGSSVDEINDNNDDY